ILFLQDADQPGDRYRLLSRWCFPSLCIPVELRHGFDSDAILVHRITLRVRLHLFVVIDPCWGPPPSIDELLFLGWTSALGVAARPDLSHVCRLLGEAGRLKHRAVLADQEVRADTALEPPHRPIGC